MESARNLQGSLQVPCTEQRFVSVLNERTSFASRARAFEGARLLNCFDECASD